MWLAKTGKISACVAAAAMMGLAGQRSEAALILELSDGFTTTTVFDGGGGDFSATPGIVVFSGTIGVFDVNVTTGLGYPYQGSLTQPELTLDSINVSGGGAGILTVKLTSTDLLGPSLGTTTLESSGTTDGSLFVQSFVDSSNTAFNTAFGTDDLTGTLGIYSDESFEGNTFGFTSVSTPYSASIITSITHDDAEDVSSFFARYNIVPEPASLALIAAGGLLVTHRRRRHG